MNKSGEDDLFKLYVLVYNYCYNRHDHSKNEIGNVFVKGMEEDGLNTKYIVIKSPHFFVGCFVLRV
jgi:hypothetical protein